MNQTALWVAFASGALALGHALAGLFFLRFWRDTHDRLFAWFAAAFGMLAVQRFAVLATFSWLEQTTWAYVIRLIGFVLIIIGIVEKNRTAQKRGVDTRS